MIPSEKVYTLKNQTGYYGFVYRRKAFIVAFPSKKDALDFSSSVNTVVNVNMKKHGSVNESVFLSKITVPKKKAGHALLDIESQDVNAFMDLPISKNIGIVFALDVFAHNRMFELESLVVHPMYDIESYRESLLS